MDRIPDSGRQPEIQRAMLSALVDGARIASRELWGARVDD
jgi:hypothetical protein